MQWFIMRNMPNITLYMKKEYQDQLKQLAKKEHRSTSQQVIHMMEYYIKRKKQGPEDIEDLTELSSDLRGQ